MKCFFPLLAVRLEIVAFQGCQFERFENWWGGKSWVIRLIVVWFAVRVVWVTLQFNFLSVCLCLFSVAGGIKMDSVCVGVHVF